MGVYETLPSENRRFGYRIYSLTPNSPLHTVGVSSLSDFIIPPEELYTNKKCFVDWVAEHAGEELSFQLYSLKTRVFTEIKIKTSSQPTKEGVLGAFIRYENWSTAHTGALHVIGVKKSSFADKKLNLEVGEDYIIAIHPSTGGLISLNEPNSDPLTILSNAIRENIGKECKFYIYNCKKGEGRVEKARIDDDYHFQLGCDVAYGKLHEFPYFRKDTEEKVGDVVEEKCELKKEEKGIDIVQLEETPVIKESEIKKEIDDDKHEDAKANENEEKLDEEDNTIQSRPRLNSAEIKNEETNNVDVSNEQNQQEETELPMLKDMI